MRAWIGSLVAAAAAMLSVATPAMAAAPNVTIGWYTSAIIKLSLTPNYANGFGTVKAVFGTQPTPAPGPGALLDGGFVDFGPVIAGTNYLYKYAVHLNITSNDVNGFNLYAEGASDFTGATSGGTSTLNQTLYYLPSTNGVTTDSNTGFSPSFPFYKTSQTILGSPNAPYAGPAPAIQYSTYPSPIYQSTTGDGDAYYDFELKVPPTLSADTYYVWVLYTVVAR